MNRNDIIRMAREVSGVEFPAPMNGVKIGMGIEHLERFVKLIVEAEREKVAEWMMKCGYATGHGESIEDLLGELAWQIAEKEREACAKVLDEMAAKDKLTNYYVVAALAIRERGAP